MLFSNEEQFHLFREGLSIDFSFGGFGLTDKLKTILDGVIQTDPRMYDGSKSRLQNS